MVMIGQYEFPGTPQSVKTRRALGNPSLFLPQVGR